MSYNIMAINPGHNGSVALVSDGKLKFFIEEERLTRLKHDANPYLGMLEMFTRYKIDELIIGGTGQEEHKIPWTGEISYASLVRKINPNVKITRMGEQHHAGHAMCAFYNSGFKKAIAIVIDGCGSFHNVNVGDDYENQIQNRGFEVESIYICEYPDIIAEIKKIYASNFGESFKFKSDEYDFDDAVTIVKAYEGVTRYLGFPEIEAGKTMGLAPYGERDENLQNLFIDGRGNKNIFIPTFANGSVIDEERNPYLKHKTDPTLWHKKPDMITQVEKNLAWQIQEDTQRLAGDLIEQAVIENGIENVVIAGGYGLNCVSNYYYKKRFPDLNIYVDPISNDAGTAIGLAKYHWFAYCSENKLDYEIDKLDSIYLGVDHNDFIDLDNIDGFTVKECTAKDVAKLIVDRNIVCLFNGAAEAGPRALGNRSILYDPRDANGKDFVNKVKGREWFRPFAGSVLEEHANDWFDMAGLESSPYMMYAVDVLKDKVNKIPCITHVDDTCRIQTVNRNQNEYYYDLINEFYKLTKVPILFNTSFNLAGDPLVESFENAKSTLLRSDLKYLYVPSKGVILEKNV